MNALIEVSELRRTFKVARKVGRLRRVHDEVVAVESVTFQVEAGETVGYIGPNGAGKSTTIKMLTGILVPTSGRIRICGLDPSRKRIELARRIGVVFGQRSQLWWDLPLAESFELLKHIYRVPTAEHKNRLEECIELLGLTEFLTTPVRQLSLGQRMRGEVTAALLHAPELLVLDEPTIGLDLESKERLREFLAELNDQRGTTLLLTTHDLDDIERLCRRMMVIDHGRVLADGPLDELRAEVAPERILVVDFSKDTPILQGLPGVVSVQAENNGQRQQFTFSSQAITAAKLINVIEQQASIHDFSTREPEIDDVVRRLYARRNSVDVENPNIESIAPVG